MDKNRAQRRKFHYIYKITRIDGSGKYYIGMHSTDDLDDGYFGSGQLLWKSIKKHGKQKHLKEILEFCETRESLKIRERAIVDKQLLEDVKCMNLTLGGGGSVETTGTTRMRMSASAKERMARMQADGSWEAVKKKNAGKHRGKVQSTETIAKKIASGFAYKEANGGKRTFSEQARLNISQSLIGSARNTKTWNLLSANGEELQVINLTKWLNENQLICSGARVVVRDSTGNITHRIQR